VGFRSSFQGKTMSKQIKQLSAVVLALISQPAISANTSDLDPVIVTATRTAITPEQALSSVSVVTREDIETFNYQSVAEVLSTIPGISIANTGGMGKQTSIFMRGTESNHTQIILNGVKLATNEFGMPQLEHIPIDQIERIEIIRGPQSSLYGSESIGGTVHIITRRGGNGLEPTLSVSYGSHDTKKTDLGISGGDENNWFNVNLGYTDTNGIDACDGRSASLSIGCYADEPDRDSYDNVNTSIRAGHRFDNQATLEVFSLRSRGTSNYDGYYQSSAFEQHTYGVTTNLPVNDKWEVVSSLSQGIMNRDDKTAVSTSTADNKTNSFSLQNNLSLSDNHTLTLGYDYENDYINKSAGYSVSERDNHAIFGQLLGQLSTKSDYRIALRTDDNEQFGNHTTGNIAWGTKITDSTRFHASYGTAFVAPSFVDLYSPYGANDSLKPEESKSYEFGFAGQHLNVDWEVNTYQTDIDNLIVLDSFWVPQNIEKARIQGIEFIAGTTLFDIDFNGQVSLLNPKDRTTDQVLARRAKQTLTLNAVKTFNQWKVASSLYVSGKRFDDQDNTRRLGGFTTLDITTSYQVNKEITLQFKAANLFDKDYETASGYNQDGANYLVSLHYRP
jgi:vitamin B12 transporter